MIPIPLVPRREFAPQLAQWWRGNEPLRVPGGGTLVVHAPWVGKPDLVPVPGPGQAFLTSGADRGVIDLADLFDKWIVELLARAKRVSEQYGAGLHWQTCELVNEAYLRLHRSKRNTWDSAEHFLQYVTKVMRSVLVDHYRRQQARGGDDYRVDGSVLDRIAVESDESDFDREGVALVLKHLARTNPEMARAAYLRFFHGSEMADVARTLDLSQRTLERRWSAAREWLAAHLRKTVGW